MRTKLTVALMVLLVVFYAAVIGAKGVALLREGGVVPVLLGSALLALPVLGLLLVWREVRFGQASARLGAELDAEGGLLVDDLPRRPSGRVERSAADDLFDRVRAEVEAAPEDWRGWYRLALAYDAAGDRTRARAAVRDAITLHAREQRPG